LRTSRIVPPYRTATEAEDAKRLEAGLQLSELPPKFSSTTLQKWFLAVSKGAEMISRRGLLFALNESEELFSVFCAADLHKEKLHNVSNISEGVAIPGASKMYTQESFGRRIAILRHGLDVLDRIDWERNKAEMEGLRSHSLSQGSLSRKLTFEVFLTYFKYQDMLLEYMDTSLNYVFQRERSKLDIHQDCQLTDSDREEASVGRPSAEPPPGREHGGEIARRPSIRRMASASKESSDKDHLCLPPEAQDSDPAFYHRMMGQIQPAEILDGVTNQATHE